MKQEFELPSSFLAKLYFLAFGGGCQIGWYAVLNGLDFFDEKFPGESVKFRFGIAVYLAQFLVTPIMAKISERFNLSSRVIVPFIAVGAIIGFLPFQAAWYGGTEKGFWMIMQLLFVMGFLNNICYSSIIGMTSQLPREHTTNFLIGSGIAGIGMSLIRLALTSIISKDPSISKAQANEISVTIFFVVAAFFIVFCVFLHLAFVKSAFYNAFLERTTMTRLRDSETTAGDDSYLEAQDLARKPGRDLNTVFGVFSKTALYVGLIALTYVQMYTVFPGVMLQKPMPMEQSTKLTSMNMLFSVFFLIGKKLGQYRKYYNIQIIAALVMFRFVLIGFFILQAAFDLPVLGSMWFGYLNILLFGFTNGFVTCALFILAPEQIEPEKKEVSGFVNVFGLTAGIVTGTFTALPFANLR